jgi:nanoRNase/pAp phosphatase (c-di-AMP/oligoRNAs hydrolase)
VGAVLEKNEEELLALRNFGRKSYDELRDKLISMGFLSEDDIHFGGGGGGAEAGGAPARTLVAEQEADEELGPVAKALLEALKESGKEGLLAGDEDEDQR